MNRDQKDTGAGDDFTYIYIVLYFVLYSYFNLLGDVVTINIRGDTALGVLIEADKDGSAAIIRGWDRLQNGKFGAVQKVF